MVISGSSSSICSASEELNLLPISINFESILPTSCASCCSLTKKHKKQIRGGTSVRVLEWFIECKPGIEEVGPNAVNVRVLVWWHFHRLKTELLRAVFRHIAITLEPLQRFGREHFAPYGHPSHVLSFAVAWQRLSPCPRVSAPHAFTIISCRSLSHLSNWEDAGILSGYSLHDSGHLRESSLPSHENSSTHPPKRGGDSYVGRRGEWARVEGAINLEDRHVKRFWCAYS